MLAGYRLIEYERVRIIEELLAKKLPKDARVIAVLPDTGERYLSTALFEYTDLVNQPATVAPPAQVPIAAKPQPTAAP